MKFIFPVFCWVKTEGAETPDFGSPHREEKREAAKIMSRGFLSSNVVEGGGGGPRAARVLTLFLPARCFCVRSFNGRARPD